MAGASYAGTASAIADAAWARAAIDGERIPGFLAIARFDAGLVAPAALLLGIAIGAFGLILEPDRSRSPRELLRGLDPADPAAQRRLAGCLAALPVGLALWATTAAHWAKGAMASPGSNVATGLAMATLATGLLVVVVASALGAGEACASLGRPMSRRVLPIHALLAGLALGLVLIGAGVALGTTSGEGGWLGIWGVLKRPELDLRAVLLLAVVALGAYLVPHLVHRTPLLALSLSAVPFAFTAEAAALLGDHQDIAAAIERGAPLGKISLAALRRSTDRDHDGYSAFFAGGDCNDRDPQISPAADDTPGNGIDEDCSGSDAPRPATATAVAPLPANQHDLLPKGLNVVLITIDTLRADLGYAGNARPLSPNLDALAGRAVVFDRAYSLASYTGKSLGPLLIGKYPSETHRGWGHFNKFSNDDVFVSERLQKAGIRTISVQAHWYMSGAFGLARGYDLVDKSAQPPPGTDQDNDASVTGGPLTDAALRVLGNADNTRSRFFAWIHYLDPHSEYARHPGTPNLGSGMRAAYDGEVWYTDRQVGRLLEFIAGQAWGAKTAIVVTSDHGEAFGEHHMIRHGFELWEELVRVPLLVYVPGVPPHHVAPGRSAIDLVPTLLDFFDVAPPAPGAGKFDFLSGRSVAPDIAMPAGYEPAERDIFIDMPAGPNNDERRAFIHRGKKLSIANSVRHTVFDLQRDPGEKSAIDDKSVVSDMKAEYANLKAQLREVQVKAVPKEATSP